MRALGLVFFGIILPQGASLLCWLYARTRGIVLQFLSTLVAPVVFFIAAYMVISSTAQEIVNSGNRVCGAFGSAAAFAMLYGTLFHFAIASLFCLASAVIWKRKALQHPTK
jgi:hypothetical protein